jgi:hypothetical protein
VRAFSHKALDRRKADARTAAGDQRDFVGKSTSHGDGSNSEIC